MRSQLGTFTRYLGGIPERNRSGRLCLDCAAWWRPEPPHGVACYDPEAELEELCPECRAAVESLKSA